MLPHGGLGAHRPCGSAAPTGTLVQLPALPGTLHAWQVGHAAELQHTPSKQLAPVRQSAVAVHDWPRRRLLPQRFVSGSQIAGARQSVSTVHAPRQAVVPLHTYGAHASVVAAWHTPRPSQVRPEVAVDAPAGQLGAAHEVAASYKRQLPLPSQNPSVLHDAGPMSAHMFFGSASPLATLVHVPIDPSSAHDLHRSVHALPQHTPCTQKPDAHSLLSLAQGRPFGLRPQLPLMHTAGVAQSASLVHELLHAPTPHRNGKHEVAAGFTQVPAPSQVDVAVEVVVATGQVGSAHDVPIG